MRALVIDKTAVLSANHERFAALAAQPGVELTVLSPRVWIEHGRSIAAEVTDAPNYRIVLGRTLGHGRYARGCYLTGLGRALRLARPEIVQLLEEPYSFFAAQTLRQCRLWAPRAKVLFYTWENIYRPFKYPARVSWLYARIDRRMYRRAAGAVCATAQAERVLRLKGFSAPTAVIPYGVPQAFFDAGQDAPRPLNGGSFTVGYLGRYLAMKGVEDLLSACSGLPEARLELFGAGEDETMLKSKASQLGLGERARFHPPAPPEDVPAVLRRLDALVLPSRTTHNWSEQLGRVLIEAMAAGVPVIAADSGAIPEVLDDAGLLYPEGQAQQLRARLALIQRDEPARRHLVELGRRRAAARFTWPRFAADLSAFWRDLLSGRAAAPDLSGHRTRARGQAADA
ncbi:glycosyltransferase [bacterium]|nr:glycosyltransferase [bacterium]